jgi:hypothetical protein
MVFMPLAACSEAVLSPLPLISFLDKRLLGEALCRGRSPERTQSAVLGGSDFTPSGGLELPLLLKSKLLTMPRAD